MRPAPSSEPRVHVRAFEPSDVPAAGALLAERHRLHRLDQPHLPAAYQDATTAATAVSAALETTDASGAVAVRNGRVVGFLLGAPKPGPVWGPNVWVESAGQATEEPEVMRDLYALAASRWVEEGRTAHYVLVPAHDAALVGAWFRLGFGHQHTHGVRGLPGPSTPLPPALEVRRARRDDIPVLAEIDLALPAHQGLAPTFSAGTASTLEESVAEWEEDIDDPEFATFVAVHGGAVVGSASGCALAKSGSHSALNRPDDAGFLGFAAVLPAARGLGAGRALGEQVIRWAEETGFACVATDWRETNLLSSRAWPALGFTPTFVRLHRLIGF